MRRCMTSNAAADAVSATDDIKADAGVGLSRRAITACHRCSSCIKHNPYITSPVSASFGLNAFLLLHTERQWRRFGWNSGKTHGPTQKAWLGERAMGY